LLESVQKGVRDIQRETGLEGGDAVVYYYARKAGWDHDDAMKIALERKILTKRKTFVILFSRTKRTRTLPLNDVRGETP
jgi:hypothetical protein